MAMRVKKELRYDVAGHGVVAIIPRDTTVKPADNLPDGGYWVQAWPNMSWAEESWHRNYGFHVNESEVYDCECCV